ncbi:S8 family peptidase [Halorubrum ruber]|uniref:S8 family serine peptidase n=1 Tax=Halorubrum ruber TaxID=2982524 RepID=A0A8T8LH76_9EURY|nr:S8 family serine peptidase [Halorubrum ruber]QUO46522.1 S8 family serine peptidase [Halorubrum ruber]
MLNVTKRDVLKVSGSLIGGIAAGTTVTAAERTDRFIVSTKGKADLSDLTVVHEMPGINYSVVRGDESAVKRSVKSYEADVQIELDSPGVNDDVPTLDEADYEGPNDVLQWDKIDQNVPEAHETTEGEGTRVAVIDSGVLETHPDLEGPLNLDLSRNFTDDGGDHNPVGGDDHGTHVAGIVAADNGGGTGVNGTAPKTDLVDCRVFSAGDGASFGDILAAVVYSANIDADVANLSLGAYPVPRQANGQFYGKVLNSAMTYANKEGTLLVIAAGNDSADLQHDKNLISLPNEGAQAVSVASTGPIGYGLSFDLDDVNSPAESPAVYTNYGTNAVTLGAPGGDYDLSIGDPVGGVPAYAYDLVFNTVFSVETDEDGESEQVPGYGWKAGTSMAAPNVAGAAALVKSANPDYNANQVEAALKKAAEVPDDYGKEYYGAGYLNVVDAL